MAGGVPRGGEIVVPIDAAAPEGRQGTITLRSRGEEPTGLYAFTFYCRAGLADKDLVKYLIGMNFYRMLVNRPEFAGWKFIVYVDAATLQELGARSAEIQEFFGRIINDPKAILATVDWPEYTWPAHPGEIEDTIMRCMRYHAFHHFTDIPVYVRDADTTLFLTAKLDEDTIQKEFNQHSHWEILFREHYEGFSRGAGSQFSMLYSTTVEYEKDWHRNARLPVKNNRGLNHREGPLLGIYAGMMACQGNVPEWKSGELWAASLEYLRSVCRFVQDTGRPSNIYHRTPLRIGKDEQLPLFIWLPILYGRIFFYHYRFATPNLLMYWPTSRGELYKNIYKRMTRKYPKLQKLSKNSYGTPYFSYNEEFFMDPADKLGSINMAFGGKTFDTAEELVASQRERLEGFIKADITDRDDPVLEYTDIRLHPELFTFPLTFDSYYKTAFEHRLGEKVNPYTVLEPFRNLRYHEFIFFAMRAFISNYVMVCERERVPTRFEGRREEIEREMAELPPPEELPTTTLSPDYMNWVKKLIAQQKAVAAATPWTPKGGRRTRRSRRGLRKRKTLRKRR